MRSLITAVVAAFCACKQSSVEILSGTLKGKQGRFGRTF